MKRKFDVFVKKVIRNFTDDLITTFIGASIVFGGIMAFGAGVIGGLAFAGIIAFGFVFACLNFGTEIENKDKT